MRLLCVATSALALSVISHGCAKPPDSIRPVANRGPCTAADKERLIVLSQKQSQAATSDAVGVFLIGVPIASLSGADNEAEIAILKGRCQIR
jgi:hypothetical protein